MKEYFEVLFTKSKKNYFIKLSKYLDNHEKKFIITANPETFRIAETDKLIRNILLQKDNDIIPDGIAIVKCAKFFKIRVEERIPGIDVASKLLELCNKKNKTLYLFGAKKDVLEKLVEIIKQEYSRIKILGYSDGYSDNKDEVFRQIIKLQPDVCLVALGIPLQETLIAKYINLVEKGVYMGVGGSFDVLSKTKKRAPKIFIKFNLEWLYRIVTEPSRLKRFYNNNIKFVFRVLINRNKVEK